MDTSKDIFKKGLVNNYMSKVGGEQSQTLMQDMNKYSKEMREEEKLKGGLADKKTLKDLAMKHAYDDSKDTTSKGKIVKMLSHLKSQFEKGLKVEKEHTKDVSNATEIVMDHLSEDPKYYDKLSKMETKEEKGTAKQQFASDLQTDKDYIEFKKNSKYKKGGSEFTFGTPNVTKDDPYISKKTKYGRPGRGKEESNEATGSGSSGGYVGPVAFMDSDFVRNSFKETPGKLKEGLAVGAMGMMGETPGETTEATTSGSVGGYETPAMWAKSTKKKDWGPSRKTQYKGGAFVKVKKKCTRFPYCNQGDINALKISKNESVKEAIKNVSQKHNISEDVIKTILEFEYSKIKR